jgi:hypothetical protein
MPKQVDYEKALCKGMDTELFYGEEDLLYAMKTNLLSVRKICFKCPIQKECMEYGFTYERYGMFGGITGEERYSLRKRNWKNPKVEKLLRDLIELGVSINEILPMTDIKHTPIGGKE